MLSSGWLAWPQKVSVPVTLGSGVTGAVCARTRETKPPARKVRAKPAALPPASARKWRRDNFLEDMANPLFMNADVSFHDQKRPNGKRLQWPPFQWNQRDYNLLIITAQEMSVALCLNDL